MEAHPSFVPLLIVVGLAALVPLLTSRLRWIRIPTVVGEIVAGIIVGESGLKWVSVDETLEFLALLGFAYLMFLSGLEVEFDALFSRVENVKKSIKERLKNPLFLGGLSFVLTLILAGGAALLLREIEPENDPWVIALILSTTSLGLVVPVLKERNLMGQSFGQSLLVAAVIADFATMILVSIYVILHTQGLSLEVLLVLLLFGVFGTVYRIAIFAHRKFPGLRLFQGISNATAQIDARGAFAIGLAFIALAQSLGVEMILGAFLGGALISLLADRKASDLHHRLDVIGYAFFIPIFFIMVGVEFDLHSVFDSPESLLLVPLFLLLAYAVKITAALLFRLAHSWRQTFSAGSILASHLSLEIAVAAIGLQLGVINQSTNSAIILVAILTCIFSPLLFNRILPQAPTVPHRFVIVGTGKLAQMLARRIKHHGNEVIVLKINSDTAISTEDGDIPVISGDFTREEFWQQIQPETIQAVALLLPDETKTLQICQLLKSKFGIDQVAARVQDPIYSEDFHELDVQVVNPTLALVMEFEYVLLFPSVSSLMASLDKEHEVLELRLSCPKMVNQRLKKLKLPEGVMVVLIRRDGEVIHPHGNTYLELGDQLTLMGPTEGVHEMALSCE